MAFSASNMYLHYSAVNSWLTIPTFLQSEIIKAKSKPSAFWASPTGDALNARDMGMGRQKTRGCPYHWQRFVTSHSRFALDSVRNHAKNEAPKEDTDTDQNFWMYKTQRKVVPSSRIFLPPCKKPLRNVALCWKGDHLKAFLTHENLFPAIWPSMEQELKEFIMKRTPNILTRIWFIPGSIYDPLQQWSK